MAEINLKDYPTLDKYTHPVKKPEREIVGRDAEKKSIFASFLRPELCNVILLGDAGSGKAHPNDTLLPSPCEDGYIRLGDIKVGDKVYDENGKPVIVKGVYPRGLKRVFRVTFKDGRSVLCNDDHIWHVRNLNAHNKGRSYKNLTLKEIMKEGVKKVKVSKNRKPRNLNNWYIPVNEAVYRDEKKYVLDPYVLGVIIGDGCVSDLKSQMNVSSSDESVIKEVSKRLGSYGYVRNEHNYNWLFLKAPEDESRNFYQVHDFPDKSDELLSVFGKLSKEKSIPRSYMLGSIDQRFKLLQGLLDTDGYVSNNDRLNVKFSTASEKLAKDVVELSNSLGIRTTLTRFDRTYKDRPDSTEYEIYFITDIETRRSLFYACDRKIAIFEKYLPNRVRKFNRHYDDLAITNVEDLGYDTEMTCIYVDSESHLYQVGKEHIVTHNTALVQSCAIEDIKRHYREVDLSKMISELDDMDKLANLIKTMFAEASKYSREMGKEVVMFIDEFHQIIHLSKAAVEALKPILADSGTRGLRIIFATTFEEFEEFVKPNQALVERLERINIRGASKELVIKILKGMSKRYKVDHLFYNDSIYELIYEYTNRYIPANSQPRKSILVLDRMIGWHRYSGRAMDFSLLADVLAESEGVNVNFKVKANEIKDRLNRKVLAQEFAVDAVTQRLFICVAGLNNPGKPMGSFLFTGSTGSGKTALAKEMTKILFDDNKAFIRFDMTEFALDESLERFRDTLTNRVFENPNSIILLDEIEKAGKAITHVLLQVLDDGRLLDKYNREVSFVNSYIILTTNVASDLYSEMGDYTSDTADRREVINRYMNLVKENLRTTSKEKFPPELLGRIDSIAPFMPLQEETLMKICIMELAKIKTRVRKIHNMDLIVTEKTVRFLVRDLLIRGSDSGGARQLLSIIDSNVNSVIAEYVSKYPYNKQCVIDVHGEIASDNKNKRENRGVYIFAADKELQ